MRTLLVDSGFRVIKLSYYNTWLFPLAVVVRFLRRCFPASDAGVELAVPPAPVNAVLAAFFASERYILPYLNLPFGVSLIALVKKHGQ